MKKGIIKALIYLVVVALVACAAVYLYQMYESSKEPSIDGTFVSSKLEAASELTAAKMIYNGLIRYSDGKIPYITQKAFSMTYRAQVRAGIDLTKVVVQVTETEVMITLPPIEVEEPVIEPDSIEYYDQKSAIFNPETKDDALDAIKAAVDDVMANGDIEGLKATARLQLEVLMQGLFEDSIGERVLTVIYS